MTIQRSRQSLLCAIVLSIWCSTLQAQDVPGASVDSLLAIARANNSDYAGMRQEAVAASERIVAAGSLPDPKLRTEWRDITRMGDQNPTLAPGRVGSTRYLLMQDIPWFGKRELKREIAEFEAAGAQGRAGGNWADLAARIKSTHAQRYYLHRNVILTREILDLLARLEKIAQVRYASGLAAPQELIRAQIEQTGLMNELLSLENQQQQLQIRLNTLLGRAASAALAAPEKLPALPSPAALDYAALEARVRARNPLLFAEESRLKAAEKNRELTYRNRYPDVTLGVSPIQYGSAVKEWEVMLELNIPLQQASRRAQEREAEAMLAAARSRRDAMANQVLGELAENLAAIDTARQAERLAASRFLPQTELSFQATLVGYQNGKVDFATLLDAQRQIRQARQNQIRAEAEARMRLADIEKLLGEDL